ncbi:MAG: hypothetical protein JEZ06_05665 [Anaerolineaceae bacterium]|nr:hypothetical protein [Anaerolineaceae bacterium]
MKIKGWLLDMYIGDAGRVCIWHLGKDGERRCLYQDFPVYFYAAGDNRYLRELWRFLETQASVSRLSREERIDVFAGGMIPVLAVEIPKAGNLFALFNDVKRRWPELTYYDADVPLALRHAAVFDTFPMAYCTIEVDASDCIADIEILETPWKIDIQKVPLRLLSIEPDADPEHAQPHELLIRYGRHEYRLSLEQERPLLINLRAILLRWDPDIIQTRWGDTWMLPMLLEMQKKWHVSIPFNRDEARTLSWRPERSYFSYGQIIFRGQQIHLFGRLHIDERNAMFWHDHGLDGILEMARVTRLPLQQSARVSPGTGISSMEIVEALQSEMLIPNQKQQVETQKTALELLRFDQGGMVYQPLVGLHSHVGEIDFISMYPSIMVRYNISPETNPSKELELSDEPKGIVPRTLEPLLKKRVSLKQRLSKMVPWDPRKKVMIARASAEKWLLVTCFGYLGYKNARFGRIESHEAVTANGREALLRAKEAAEDLGFDVLHLYVDGLWIKKAGVEVPEDFENVLDQVAKRTGLDISLDGIYRWVVFLPSRVDRRVPVPNRYFGVFKDGSIKIRGIEARRRDTPVFIKEAQLEILEHLAQAEDVNVLFEYIPGAIQILRNNIWRLRNGSVPLENLLLTQRLSRELSAYRVPSAAARAAMQLQDIGKEVRPGQRVRFLHVIGSESVLAWDLVKEPDYRILDNKRYLTLLLRAAATILEPLGWAEEDLWTMTTSIPAVQMHMDDCISEKERKICF